MTDMRVRWSDGRRICRALRRSTSDIPADRKTLFYTFSIDRSPAPRIIAIKHFSCPGGSGYVIIIQTATIYVSIMLLFQRIPVFALVSQLRPLCK